MLIVTAGGETLAVWEQGLLGGREATAGPLTRRVPAEWVDYNGHVHESRYLQLFGDATDALLGSLGVDGSYLERGTYMTAETHLSHLGQLHAGDEVTVTTQVLGADEKRLHVFHTIWLEGDAAATAEQMLLHVDAASGRVGAAAPEIQAYVLALAAEHAGMPRPDRAGRRIGG